ncbi:hypothetical protein REPUB_Repub10bG0176400 [Reevesia pubescens]
MESSAKNFSQIKHRLLLRHHNSRNENDYYSNQIAGRIVLTIIVAMLSLCLIVFMIYKCFHRTNHSSDHQNPTEPKPSIDIQLASIPVLVYGESTLPSVSHSSCSHHISLDLENCAICLEDYVHGETVRVLPKCNHMFHKNCIEEWLQVPSLHCPICRDRILEHCLQSTRSNNCRNQIASGNSFPLLAFNFGAILIDHNSYPSVLH